MTKYFFIISSLLISDIAGAQELWSLEKCIEYALENNLDVRQDAYRVENAETNVNEAKNQFLPSLNASANYGYNFGQRIDPFTNKFAQNAVNTGSFTSLPIGCCIRDW